MVTGAVTSAVQTRGCTAGRAVSVPQQILVVQLSELSSSHEHCDRLVAIKIAVILFLAVQQLVHGVGTTGEDGINDR